MKRILCLCDYGEHRSVIMAKVLRERGHFAVAGSYDNYANFLAIKRWRELETIKTTFDKVIFMQEGGEHFIGRDEPNVSDYEWEQRCKELAAKLTDLIGIKRNIILRENE